MRRFACGTMGRRSALAVMAALLADCGGSREQATTDTAAARAGRGDTAARGSGTAAGGGATLALADLAGKWTVRSAPETGRDTTTTTYVLTATATTSGWTVTFPHRPAPVPTRVLAVAGDSVVTETGPYESVRRTGVRVTTHTVLRRQGVQLVGTTVAGYQTTGPDSVLRFRTAATRAP